MKNRIAKMITGVVIMILPLSLLFGCKKEEDIMIAPSDQGMIDSSLLGNSDADGNILSSVGIEFAEQIVEGEELMCLVSSDKEAQEIAEKYGIEVVNVTYGVATFHTDKDPYEVIEEGKKKGYPLLEINAISELN